MTVNIGPADSYTWLTETNNWIKSQEECMCVWEGKIESNCVYCQGSGVYTSKTAPFGECLNIANGNMATLHSALGLPGDSWSGSCSPQVMAQAILELDTSLVCRVPSVEYNEEGPTVYNGGIHEEQTERYVEHLRAIVIRAVARNVDISWA